jgi:hypothetical protein
MLAAVILALATSQTGKGARTAWVALGQLVSEALPTPSAQTRGSANCSGFLQLVACSPSRALVCWALTV